MAGPFSPSQLLFVERFAEALFDGFAQMAVPVSQVVANFSRQFELIGGTPVGKMKLILVALPALLGPDFNDKPVAHRRYRIEQRLAGNAGPLYRDLARLRAVIYGAYYGHWMLGDQDGNRDNPVHRQIGYTLPKFRTRAPGEPQLTLRHGHEIDPAHVLGPAQMPGEVDYVVIGSGSGGAVAAHNLAAHGTVLVIEAGPWMPSPAITHEERLMGAKLFKNGTLQTTGDNDIVIFQGRNVGGSPTINNGICLRMAGDPLHNPTTPDPFATWQALGADIGRRNLDDAYREVADFLALDRSDPRAGQGNGNHLVDGWNRFAAGRTEPWITGARPGWFPRNFGARGDSSACASSGYCNTGCPYGRKRAMAQEYLPAACVKGARILPDSKVEKILFYRAPTTAAPVKAIAVVVTVGEDQDTRAIAVRKGVVVAAGTIASSKLLASSRIKNTGEGLSLNVASPVVALMPATATPSWDESQMTTAVDCGDFWLESHFQPPQSMAMLMGGWFGEIDRRMRNYGRMRSAGVLLPLDRRGKLSGDTLDFTFKPADVDLLRRALATLTRVHFANGALEVWPSLRSGRGLMPGDDIDAFYESNVKTKDDVMLSSAHPHGGNAMNADPNKGVVNLRGNANGTTNVLVADASVFPSCIGVNAQYTVMAVAHLITRADPATGAPPI